MDRHVKGVLAAAAALSLVAAGCGGGGTPGGGTPGGGAAACEPAFASIEVSAEDISFDRACLAAPVGQPFTIEFTNNDAGITHNVAIYTDESATEGLFVGEIFQGTDTRTYEVPALDAGTYFFRCDVHPTQMTGTFVVK